MAKGKGRQKGPKRAPIFKIPMKGDNAADRLALVADQFRRAIERKKHADKMLAEAKKGAAAEGYSVPAILRALKMEGMTDARQTELLERERNNLDLAERYREIILETDLEGLAAKPGKPEGEGGEAPADDGPAPSAPFGDVVDPPVVGDGVEVKPDGPATITGDGSGTAAPPFGADDKATKAAIRRDAAKLAKAGTTPARPAARGRLSVVGDGAAY